jgi:2-keto-myo-inositol isomerase
MKVCFNEATTMRNSTLERDLELCEKYGYDLIEIRLDKLREYLETHTIEDLVRFFSNNKLKPFAFNALEFIIFRDEVGYNDIKENLVFLCQVGEKINCKKIVVVPTFDVGDYTKSEIKKESILRLNELADIAENYGVKLAYEFVGYPNCSVNTFGQTYDIVSSVNRDNVGMVLDCFHFHAMGSRIEDLEKAGADKIFIFHIDDSEDLPIGALRDDKRLWPGEGAVDLNLILETLREIGYSDMVSVELFRPEYWAWDAEDTVRVGKEKTIEVVNRFFEIG